MLAACGGGGGGGPSGGGDPSAPATPRGLDWSVAGGAILLDWNGVSGASNYTISRNGSRTGGDSLAATIIRNSNYTDIGVPLGNAYEYKISACNNLGCSADASLVVDYFAPTVPRNLNAVVNDGSIGLTWGASSWADNYKINRNALVLVAAHNTNTYTDSSVATGTTYNYKVMACNRVTCSADSTLLSIVYSTSPPAAPSGLKLSIGATGIVLQWSAVAGASYKINLATTELATDIAGNSYTHAGADLSASPVYNVVACNGFGCSQPATFTMDRFDLDNDNVFDAVDVDADGDGLIELRTAAELNMMRYNLNGTGLDDGTSDNDNTTGGDSTGCGGGRSGDASACNGYEQMADINLNDLGLDASGSNWERMGFCSDASSSDLSSCSASAFAGDFNGNGYIIGNLTINITTSVHGHGFFGSVKDATLRNVHIRGGSINLNSDGVEAFAAGGLVGYGLRVNITSSSVVLDALQAPRISGVGGLIGRGDIVVIDSSMVMMRLLNIGANGGGIIGRRGNFPSSSLLINSSYAVVGSIIAILGSSAGGIDGGAANVLSSITSSFAINRMISSNGGRGGIRGSRCDTANECIASYSYWDSTTLTPPDTLNGAANIYGAGKTTTELQEPTATNTDGSFPDGIYSEWDNGYCNPATGEFRDSSAVGIAGFVRAWNLGGTTDYPTLNCFPNLTPEQQQAAIRRVIVDGESPISD